MDSNICSSPSYSVFKKNILYFIRPRSDNILNVSHPKGLICLTRLCSGLSNLREHKCKHSFLDTQNPICFCGLDIKVLNHFFPYCPGFTNERQNLLLKIEMIILDILRKTDTSIISILFYGNPRFSAEFKPTFSNHLLSTYYLQKGLNLLSLQRLDLQPRFLFFVFFYPRFVFR